MVRHVQLQEPGVHIPTPKPINHDQLGAKDTSGGWAAVPGVAFVDLVLRLVRVLGTGARAETPGRERGVLGSFRTRGRVSPGDLHMAPLSLYGED